MRASLAALLALVAALALGLWLLTPGDPRASDAAGPAAAAPAVPPAHPDAGPARAARPATEPALAAGAERRDAAPAALADAESAAQDHGPGPARAVGRVVDELGRAVAGAAVRLDDPGQGVGFRWEPRPDWTDRTDEQGRFSAPVPEGLAGPALRLEVRASGFAPFDELRAAAPGAGAAELDLGTVTLTPGAVLSGRVVDDLGRGVAGAALHRIEEQAGVFFFGAADERGELLATSAADGSFRADTLAPGPWRVLVLSAEHPEQEFEGDGGPAGSTAVVLALRAGHAVSGRVLPDGDTPLEQVRVRALPAEGIQVSDLGGARPWRDVSCAADGSFLVAGLPDAEGLYELRAHVGQSSLFGTEWRSAPVTARAGEQGVVLRLQAALAISFRAVDEAGAPVPGCEVLLLHVQDGDEDWDHLDPDDERRSVDPESGVCTVRGVRPPSPASRTSLVLRREGYLPVSAGPVTLPGSGAYDFGTLVLARRPEISVRVVDAERGRPVAAAAVHLELELPDSELEVDARGQVTLGFDSQYAAVTDADGIARLPRVEGVPSTLRARRDGYAPGAPLELTLRPGERTGEPTVELTLTSGAEVEVLVVSPDGQPAAGCEVQTELGGERFARTSDRAGRARFEHLAAALYRFEVQGQNDDSFRFDDEGAPASVGPHAAELLVQDGGSYALTLERPALGALFGRVTQGGRPLAGAVCRAEERGAFFIPGISPVPEARTDAAGDYRLGPLDGGAYELVVQHPARVMDQRLEVQVAEGALRLDVELPDTSIAGRALAPDGRPLAGAAVAVEDLEGDSSGNSLSISIGTGDGVNVSIHGPEAPSVATDEQGAFELRGLRAGTGLVVSATHPDFLEGRAGPVVLDAGQRLEGLELWLGAAGHLRVTVPGAGAGVRILASLAPDEAVGPESVEGDEAPSSEAETDAQGAALLSPLAPGTWLVTAIHPDGRVATGHAAQVAAGETATLSVPLP